VSNLAKSIDEIVKTKKVIWLEETTDDSGKVVVYKIKKPLKSRKDSGSDRGWYGHGIATTS
jgi:hypothetical protein